MMALVNVSPGYWVVRIVLSENPSKPIVSAGTGVAATPNANRPRMKRKVDN